MLLQQMRHTSWSLHICTDKPCVTPDALLAGDVMRESPQFKPIIAMKWGPWIIPGKGFQPVELGPEDCRSISSLPPARVRSNAKKADIVIAY